MPLWSLTSTLVANWSGRYKRGYSKHLTFGAGTLNKTSLYVDLKYRQHSAFQIWLQIWNWNLLVMQHLYRSFKSQLWQHVLFSGKYWRRGYASPQILFNPDSFLEGKALWSSSQNAGEEFKLCCCNGDALRECLSACLCLYVRTFSFHAHRPIPKNAAPSNCKTNKADSHVQQLSTYQLSSARTKTLSVKVTHGTDWVWWDHSRKWHPSFWQSLTHFQ